MFEKFVAFALNKKTNHEGTNSETFVTKRTRPKISTGVQSNNSKSHLMQGFQANFRGNRLK